MNNMNNFLSSEQFTLHNIFSGGKYSIPVYQRPYSWTNVEIKNLLEDIFEIYNNESLKNEEKLLFTGTMFIRIGENIRNEYTEYEVVDGQQRITTFTLILMVLLNYFYCNELEDKAIREIEGYLWKEKERKINKELRVLTLGSIDKKIMEDIFNELFSKKNIIEFADEKIKEDIDKVTKNLLKNLIEINKILKEHLVDENEYYNFFDHIKNNIIFIAIKVNTNLMKLFGIFESINAKGKKLEEIDLIKNYIFQNINEEDYEEYLQKWGELIKKTDDNLMDYTLLYIRANKKYYIKNINLDNFKKTVKDLKSYYSDDNIKELSERDVLIKFIDDLLDNVKYYQMLTNTNYLEKNFNSKKLKAYFKMNANMKYIHTKALYFKTLLLIKNNNLLMTTAENIVEQAFKFILTYQSIGSVDSKRTISIFVDVQNEIYKLVSNYKNSDDFSSETFDKIINIFNKEIKNINMDSESLRKNIRNNVTYTKNKELAKILLAYLGSEINENVDYDKLYRKLSAGNTIEIDHILPQKPNKNDKNFSYYIEGEKVKFKNNQDFVEDGTIEMLKDEFYNSYLNILGNLRLSWKEDNRRKSNKSLEDIEILKVFDENINTNKQINIRTAKIIEKVLKANIFLNSKNINVKDEEKMSIIEEYDTTIKYEEFEPVSFEILEEKYQLESYKYTSLLKKLLDVIYQLEDEKLMDIAKEKFRFKGGRKVFISTIKEDIPQSESAYSLEDKIFVDTNSNSKDKIRLIFELINRIGLNQSDFKILIKER